MSPSSTIAHYRIVSKLGEGGMGAVYRATDTKLSRDVAIKVLPETFANDPDRLARFTREAQVLASLNHPNIAAIYGIEQGAIVMELVEGDDLKGPVPVETALAYARQIAIALEAAHEKGIIHRDLKPANIKITPDGVVKLLDFGLAKAAEERATSAVASPTMSPTLSLAMTQAGMILGTAAYMSPEQARGKPVDKRADIWAFAVVLYEMLTGRHLYGGGETVTDTLAAVVLTEPDYSALPKDTPPRVRKLIQRCLRKDPKLRLRDIGDARLILDEAEPPQVPQEPPVTFPAPRRPLLPWSIAAVAVLAAGWLAYRATRPAPPAPLLRLSLAIPADTSVDFSNNPVAISDDGRRVVLALRGADGKSQLYTRSLQDPKLTLLAGTENAAGPFFSPDGRWIGFVDMGAAKLKKIAAEGGTLLAICDAPALRGASWGDDGNIVTALNSSAGLMRVPASGGVPQPVTPMKTGEVTQRWPQVLPDSRAVIFTSHSSNADYDSANIDVVLTRTGERRTLVRGGFAGQYVPSGHLLYVHQSTLFATPFDLGKLAVTGPAAPVVENVFSAGTMGGVYVVSRTGLAVYLAGFAVNRTSAFLIDETGKKKLLHNAGGLLFAPRFSPDGKRLVFSTGVSMGSDLWVHDLERGQATRLSFLPGLSISPVWTPDGKIIVFRNIRSASEQKLYWLRSDGAGEPQVLSDAAPIGSPFSISPDGRHLAMQPQMPNQAEDIYIAPIEGEPGHPRLGKPERFVGTPGMDITPVFSPDGRWIAYTSNESGTFEVYVRPFPGPGGRWQISAGGGVSPAWSRGGHELLYQTLTRDVIRVEYAVKGDSFAPGKSRPWTGVQLADMGPNTVFDVAPDGKHLAAILPVGPNGEEKLTSELMFLVNFFDEVKRRVK